MNRSSFIFLNIFIGFLLGLVFMNLFHLHTLDRLYRIQNQLTNELLDKEIKLERLRENMKKQSVILIKDLQITVDYDGNILTKDKIQKSIQFYLSDLVGKELSMIDGEMIYKILDGRIIEADDKKIQLKMKYIIISERILITVYAKTLE
jgi:hypothetical protein